jgi:hypothetical protein
MSRYGPRYPISRHGPRYPMSRHGPRYPMSRHDRRTVNLNKYVNTKTKKIDKNFKDFGSDL